MKTALVWFRNDLRLADNLALQAACRLGVPVIGLFVHPEDPELRPIGAAARWWLHRSLNALAADLGALGIPLRIETGITQDAVLRAVEEELAGAVFWSQRYARAAAQLDSLLEITLRGRGLTVETVNNALLVDPWTLKTQSETPFRVFTPYFRALTGRSIAQPAGRPDPVGKPIEPGAPDIGYEAPGWSAKLGGHWQPGEAAAQQALADFVDSALAGYAEGRDMPAGTSTSRLSPHLRFGEISPRQVWRAVQTAAAAEPSLGPPAEKYLSELGWREFSYHLLHHNPDLATTPLQPKFAGMAWRDDPEGLERWSQGQTGIPIVDAGMRQLWETGWMHNRVRMLVASLLTKNLLIDWRYGENWFWDTLVDADPANNPASWQWVAGCGADAAPFFRIFNPATQGEKFDADGAYVRQWVPELAALPDAVLHRPWDAEPSVLAEAGVTLGETYPEPVVSLIESRERALAAFAEIKGG